MFSPPLEGCWMPPSHGGYAGGGVLRKEALLFALQTWRLGWGLESGREDEAHGWPAPPKELPEEGPRCL